MVRACASVHVKQNTDMSEVARDVIGICGKDLISSEATRIQYFLFVWIVICLLGWHFSDSFVRLTWKLFSPSLVPRSLVDEAEGEIWPNPIYITWSPVRNVTGEASAHAQHKFGAVKAKADFDAYNKLTTGLRHDLGILARISKFHRFHETKQPQNKVERFFLQLGRICFLILWRQRENFSDFFKVLSQFACRNMIVSFYTSSSARELKLPSISHTSFLT